MFDAPLTWEEIYSHLARERALGEALWVERDALAQGPLAVGGVRDAHEPERIEIPVSDGSLLEVREHGDGVLQISLRAAPVPSIGGLPALEAMGWVALPACALILGALSFIQ